MRRQPLPAAPNPVALARALAAHHDHVFLLQSAEGPRRLARFSAVGWGPEKVLTVENGEALLDGRPMDGPAMTAPTRVVAPHHTADDDGYGYNGGLVGYAAWDYVRLLEHVPAEPLGPTLEMGLYRDGVIYDHERRRVFYFSHGPDRADDVPTRDETGPAQTARAGEARSSHTESEFSAAVDRALAYIRDGHVFQAVLARHFEAPFQGDPFAAYEALLALNPSPYMFLLQNTAGTLMGASPEMLVRVEGGVVETDPIAGTRPLGETPRDTTRLMEELLASEKEKAEHAMLVDLARNDAGRVAAPGSVRVKDYMRVERYSHVQHLVSRVTAKLAPGIAAWDAFNAIFPAGTVSGAPKVRAMEIIHELEGVPRGPYAGAVGYLGLNGSLDTCITIRSAWFRDGRVRVGAGAGIVAESTPKGEWLETQHKATALLEALQGGA